ncbi:MAG: recombinase family protein [Candidatus Methanomethylophilaceae archaeon]|nr:recombinase family protein [Candidatus Methanomethylophilaceae archaeon]
MSSDLEGYNAVLYARVSTDDKDQTCETQIRAMKDWCKRKGVNIVQIYQDEQTGKTLLRDGFLAMIGRIIVGNNDIQILLVNESTRLTRDMKLEEIKDMLKNTQCRIRYVQSDIDPESEAGIMMDAIGGASGKIEVKKVSARTSAGMATRKLQGKHVSKPAKFMFLEDVTEDFNGGRCYLGPVDGVNHKTCTKVYPEKTVFDYARAGVSVNKLAEDIIKVSPNTLKREMVLTNRYQTYLQLYREAVQLGDGAKRVQNPEENGVIRGVVE